MGLVEMECVVRDQGHAATAGAGRDREVRVHVDLG